MEILKKYEYWRTNPIFDEKTKQELKQIKDNQKEIEDRFYKDLEFGTAGLRGILGAGTNRMNKYTVSKATQGLANYIKLKGGQEKGVVIAYDSRRMSKEFSLETALVLNANGIKTYVFDNVRPTPELSFAVRQLKAISGIVITASHNPPKYNGYKVYWEDGAQISPPIDKEIIEQVNNIQDYTQIQHIELEQAKEKGLYIEIGKQIDDQYIETIKNLELNKDIPKKDIKIVYTPLHGTGNVLVSRVLKELGYEQVYVVEEQKEPDGEFPTLSYPNPEDPKAFKLALELAEKKNADVVLATDPDADRLGIYVKDTKTNEYIFYTGNMSALLIAEYILSQKQEKNILPQNGILVKTIVSSNLAQAIAKYYKIAIEEVLTGFKYIGQKMKQYEETSSHTYLFGYEEAYGCLVGTYARDKDGISAVMMLAEAAAYYKNKGLTLWDQMNKIYEKYGYYKESQISKFYEGAQGAEKMKQILETVRNSKIEQIAGYKVLARRDYQTGIRQDYETGKAEQLTLPKSNVIYYELENDLWCCIRPSGTEPKIKVYIGVKGNSIQDADNQIEKISKEMEKMIS